jgi:hypothetical protein
VKGGVEDRLSWETQECSGGMKGKYDDRDSTLKYDFHQMQYKPFSAIRA